MGVLTIFWIVTMEAVQPIIAICSIVTAAISSSIIASLAQAILGFIQIMMPLTPLYGIPTLLIVMICINVKLILVLKAIVILTMLWPKPPLTPLPVSVLG